MAKQIQGSQHQSSGIVAVLDQHNRLASPFSAPSTVALLVVGISMVFSVKFGCAIVPGTLPAAKRKPLQMQHLGLAAVDAGYCCHERTQLHLNVEWRLDRHVVCGVVENATGQLLFEMREKPLSLHRQRSLLDLMEVPVATIRMSAFRRRKATYSLYPRAETSKKPLFKFTMSQSKLEMVFTDIMTDETCRLGSNGEQGDIEIWLQRGSTDMAKQPIAHMYPALAGTPLGYSLDIAEGVDAVMVILVCIAVHDSEPDRKWRAPTTFV
ncbi:hypothetical protein JG687_00013137 [Phytophthora cactorum]|uniref:Tubby C-terminal-like domain n=1 Tax=Phytophthora cactorum TaxID=29920 RepID=A0A8T1TZT6_9STRA|nr:hypothetical protein PC123_g19043 [Phytophthora cactorum]KAG6952230.1 hypothetical protein JG687_00013137 [Phytophthora cactorum]